MYSKKIKQMYKQPLNISFELTDSCNNSCPHCYASSWVKSKKKSKDNSLDVAEKLAEHEIFDITLTGGEPLLIGIKKLARIIDILYKKNISLSLNTNGRRLTKKICEELLKHGLSSMLISLHSSDDMLHDKMVNAVGAAKETKIGLKSAVETGCFVTANQVIDKRNIHTMFETAVNLEKLGVNAVAITRFVPPLNCISNVESVKPEKFIDEFLKCKSHLNIPCESLLPFCYCADDRIADNALGINCGGGIYSAAVSSNGDMRMCVHDSEVWGNILKEGLESVWSRISEWRTEISVPVACRNCVYLPDCMGGCRVDGKYHTGTYNAMDSWAKRPRLDLARKTIYYKMDCEVPHLLSPNLRYRTEGNSFLVFGNGKSVLVNRDGLDFINSLPKKFVPDEIIKRGGENAKIIKDYFELLHKKMFIIKN